MRESYYGNLPDSTGRKMCVAIWFLYSPTAIGSSRVTSEYELSTHALASGGGVEGVIVYALLSDKIDIHL